MKNILFLLMILIFFSCKKEVDDIVFSVELDTANGLEAGKPVIFNIKGNPNYITFYSGEQGSAYQYKNLTSLSEPDMKAFLRFTGKVENAVANSTLSVLISDSFTGLVANNYKTDSTLIVDHQWHTIIPSTDLPITQNQEKKLDIDITNYLNKPVTLAFRYATIPHATIQQPKWTISDFRIVLKLASGYEKESQDSLRRGFLPFDFNNKAAPYTIGAVAGRWNITANQKSFVMTNTAAGLTQVSNLDYVVSRPMLLNEVSPDAGVAIKSVKDRIDSYSYVFNSPGSYQVAFVAKNATGKAEKEIIKYLKVNVK